jgi:hypothetical protein
MSAEDGSHPTVVQATNRRGKVIRCGVTCSPLVGTDKIVRGTIVVVVEEPEPSPANWLTPGSAGRRVEMVGTPGLRGCTA